MKHEATTAGPSVVGTVLCDITGQYYEEQVLSIIILLLISLFDVH